MSTQVLAWLGSVFVVLLAAAVLGAVVWGACWLAAWAWNWRRFRGGVGDDYTDGDGSDAELRLAPERTWEQMTSHQLPIEPPDPTRSAIPATGRGSVWSASFGAERERRAPWWEVQQRAAYESLGFDYPSGLLARVRELTP